MARPYKQKTIAEVVNHQCYVDFENRLRLIAKTMFEWTGLPEKISTRFLENALYHKGYCVFYDDDTFGYMVADCTLNNMNNIYKEPTEVTTIALDPNYQSRTLKVDKDCILIRNNVEMIPTSLTIELFAWRLYECQRSTDINIMNQKYPYFITCDKNSVYSFKKIFEDIQGNEPAIFADKSMNPESFKTIQTEAPYVADKLTIQKHEIWNEAMTFLGLNNANTDKKERLITDEVNSNNELIEMMAEVMLNQRKEACKQINKMFDLNVDVKLRTFKKEEVSINSKPSETTSKPSNKVVKMEGVS